MTLALFILLLHFHGDFIMQTDQMALNKSTSNKWLLIHVLVYGIPFLILNWRWGLLNIALHFVVDFFSSRLTSHLWKKEMRHEFFVVIGLDQFLHAACLLGTWGLFA